jgi:hypothetical protein
MRTSIFVVAVLASALLSPAVLAENPDAADIVVCVTHHAPGCGYFLDAKVNFTNQSSTYYYRFDGFINAHDAFMHGCKPCHKNAQQESVELAPLGSTGFGVVMPTDADIRTEAPGECSSCDADGEPSCCDNLHDGNGNCYFHQWCANAEASAFVSSWSTDGVTWTDFGSPIYVGQSEDCESFEDCDVYSLE